MSMGLSLIRAIAETGSRHSMRGLDERMFTPDERGAFNWVSDYYRRFGQVPTMALLMEAGFNLPPANGTVDFYIDRLRQRGVYNTIVAEQPNLTNAMQVRDMEAAQATLRRMLAETSHFQNASDVTTLREAAEQVEADFEIASRHPGMRGITFGWDYLDDLTLGAQPGDVVTFVARPAMGKSYTIIRCANSAYRAGHSCLFVSMEMTTLQTARRSLAMMAGINPDLIRRGQLSHWGRDRFHEIVQAVEHGPQFHLLSGSLKKSARDVDALIQELNPAVVYIDASYLLHPESKMRGKARWENLAEVGEEIKTMALRRNVPIIQTVQFNREVKKGKELDLAQIGGTDVIGQVSSIVIGLKEGQPPHERTRRQYEVLKNRDGDVGIFTTNYLFNPFNMDYVTAGEEEGQQAAPVNVDWMV